jgi:hypothetical protein
MLGKFNRHHLNSIYSNTKKHLGNVYHHTKNVLGHIDNGINVGRTIFCYSTLFRTIRAKPYK